MRWIAVVLLLASTAAADPTPECACGPAAIAAERERMQAELDRLHHTEQFQHWQSRRRLSHSLRNWATFAASAGTGALAAFAIVGAAKDGTIRFDAGSFPFITAMTLLGATVSLGIAAHIVDPGPYQPIPPAPTLSSTPRHVVGYAWAF